MFNDSYDWFGAWPWFQLLYCLEIISLYILSNCFVFHCLLSHFALLNKDLICKASAFVTIHFSAVVHKYVTGINLELVLRN